MILRRITVTLSQISTNVFRLTQAKFSSSKIEREKKTSGTPIFFTRSVIKVLSVGHLPHQVLVEGFWEATNYVRTFCEGENVVSDERNA